MEPSRVDGPDTRVRYEADDHVLRQCRRIQRGKIHRGREKFDATEENLQPYGVEFMAQLHRSQAVQARLISKTAINAKQPP